MGTSSMYIGPSGNPLLPGDFEDPLLTDNKDNNEEEHQENEGEQVADNNPDVDSDSTDYQNESEASNEDISNKDAWRNAKSFMSRIASGNSSNYRKGLSSYVKAHGGARKAAKSASSGTKTTVSLGRFISGTYGSDVRSVLEGYKIDYKGRSAVVILSKLINFIAPIPITKEDSIARKALIRTMEKLYELIEDENNDISTLEKIDKEVLDKIIPIQIESYIYERLLNDLGYRIETKSETPTDAIKLEKEIKEYIQALVETTLKGTDFSNFKFIEKEVEGLYNQCYLVMEDITL